MKIAVARDEAFNFTYRENIDRLREIGEVIFFSPIHDKKLPLSSPFSPLIPELRSPTRSLSSLLYLPGGYPEFFLKELSANTSMLTSIHDYIEQGGRCLAECGGMMYLCRHIIDEEGTLWPMAAVLPDDATMLGKHLHLGYRDWLGFRGHEFHYSSIVGNPAPYYIYKNLRASYVHLYWGDKNILDLWKDFTP